MESGKHDDLNSALYFSRIQKEIDKRLAREVRRQYPPNLYGPIKYALQLRGKRLRPLLTVLACEAVGGDSKACFDAALAIEMLHCFTLVHDDIMDGDKFRRGQPTIHEKWDSSVAILTGDALIALAYQALLRVVSPEVITVTRIFSRGIVDVCEGQSLDKDFESEPCVSTRDYLRMIHWKTATLLSISAEIGGILGGGNPAQIAALRKFGETVGMAFQIQDDLLDIVAEEKLLGKDLGSDLAQGKKTYPLLLLKERAPSEYDGIMNGPRKRGRASPPALEKVKSLLDKHGVINDIRAEVHRRIARACRMITQLPSPFEHRLLVDFAGRIEKRIN